MLPPATLRTHATAIVDYVYVDGRDISAAIDACLAAIATRYQTDKLHIIPFSINVTPFTEHLPPQSFAAPEGSSYASIDVGEQHRQKFIVIVIADVIGAPGDGERGG